MPLKTQNDRLAFEAAIRANAVSYRVHLFLGRGQYDRADTNTLEEAVTIGAAMKAVHPTCQALPIYYAIEASGHATTVTPAQFNEETKMIKSTLTAELTATRSAEAIAAEKKERKLAAQRTRRENQKKAAGAPETEPVAFLAPGSVEPAPEPIVEAAAPARAGVEKSRAAALTAARLVYGDKAVAGTDFSVTKTARGDFAWGPVETAQPLPRAARATRKAARAASKPPTAKRAAALEAAERGELPTPPDFSADTHKRFRDPLAEIVKMVEASDVAGLEANTVQPLSSSRVALCRYRDLAIVALKASLAKAA